MYDGLCIGFRYRNQLWNLWHFCSIIVIIGGKYNIIYSIIVYETGDVIHSHLRALHLCTNTFFQFLQRNQTTTTTTKTRADCTILLVCKCIGCIIDWFNHNWKWLICQYFAFSLFVQCKFVCIYVSYRYAAMLWRPHHTKSRKRQRQQQHFLSTTNFITFRWKFLYF